MGFAGFVERAARTGLRVRVTRRAVVRDRLLRIALIICYLYLLSNTRRARLSILPIYKT
jgi:hypothetical protein